MPHAALGLLLAAWGHLGPQRPLSAQDTLSFSTLEVSAGVSGRALTEPLSRSWSPSPGLQLSFLAPYGPGAVRLSVEVGQSAARSTSLPDYRTVFPTIEWGFEGAAPLGTRWYAGAGMGAYWMSFARAANPDEVEMALVASALLRRDLGAGWLVGAGGRFGRVLTSAPLDQGSVFLEIGRRWGLGGSVRRALGGGNVVDGGVPAPLAHPGRPDEGGEETRPSVPASRDSAGVGAAELRKAGVLRLSEVFRALPEWDVATVDQRTAWAAPDGLSAFEDAAWDVLVDGIPVPLDVLGARSLDRLPIDLGEVASVEAPATPGLREGRFRTGGLLHFRTEALERGHVELRVRGLAENATGDPGPFLHIDSTSSNLDKIGSGYEVAGRWRAGPLSGGGGFAYRSDLVTDPRVGSRTFSLRDPGVHYPVIRTFARWAALRVDALGGRHAARVGRSLRRDYFFLPVLGFEVPAEATLSHAGAAGELEVARALRLDYRVWGAWDALEEWENDLGLDYDLHTRRRGARGGLTWGERWRISLGGGVEDEAVDSRWLPAPWRRTTFATYASGGAPLGAGRASVDVEVREAHGDIGLAAALHGRLPLGEGARADVSLWHSRTPGAEGEGYWALHRRGYDFLASAGVVVEQEGEARRRQEEGVELRVRVTPREGLEISPLLRATRFGGVGVAEPSFVLEDRLPEHEGPVVYSRSTGGDVLAAGVEALWSPVAELRFEGRYRLLEVVSGDGPFRTAWEALPRHRWVQRASWSPRRDLWLAARVEARSATRWAAYRAMGSDRMAPGFRADVAVEKEIWDGRMRLGGRVGDLLDQERPLHPLGAAPGLAVAVEGAVRLGG